MRYFVLLLGAGCATHYVPKVSGDIRWAAPATLAPRGSISLVNSQGSGEEFAIGRMSTFEPVETSLREWTEVVIAYARGLLGAQANVAAGAAGKRLGLRVLGAKMTPGQYASLVPVVRPSCEVELEVSTGGGYRGLYRAAGKKFYSWDAACEDATREVAAQVFQDFQIIRYLME